MKRWFNSLPRLVQLILLLIPVCNWFFEITVRWSNFFEKKSLFSLIIAILVTFCGLAFGWVDFVWVLLFKHLIFAR